MNRDLVTHTRWEARGVEGFRKWHWGGEGGTELMTHFHSSADKDMNGGRPLWGNLIPKDAHPAPGGALFHTLHLYLEKTSEGLCYPPGEGYGSGWGGG